MQERCLIIRVKFIPAQNIVTITLMTGNFRKGKKFILRPQLRAEGEDNLLCLVQRDDAVEVCHRIEIFAQEARGRVLQRDFPIPGVQLPACVFLRKRNILFLAHVFLPSAALVLALELYQNHFRSVIEAKRNDAVSKAPADNHVRVPLGIQTIIVLWK